MESGARLCHRVEEDLTEFLSRGGRLDPIDPAITADPPKPENSNESSTI